MLMLQAVSDTDDHRQVSGSQSPALVFPLPRHSSIRRIKEELYGELFDESIFFNASIHHLKCKTPTQHPRGEHKAERQANAEG